MAGKVILVGAGPGDPGLLTVRGRQALEGAEVVVYDRLAGPAVLALIPRTARGIDVGKAAACHPVPQEQINRILVEEARAGRQVVRLKGGDPFVFGRGGEEAEALKRAGVAFEVVPGVTSAVAAPACAGIPVTHRDYSSSLHILTGHARRGGALSIDFDALVRCGGTLVFLMGLEALPRIVGGLLEAGMDPQTPAALVENGTLPSQRCCRAPLASLAERAAELDIHSPALILVGPVCALSLDGQPPLRGKRILVTRPRGRSGPLSERLRALGAEVAELPLIETVPIRPCPAMEAALAGLSAYEWLALTSPAGVEALWTCLRDMGRDARQLGGVKLASIGPGTARALEDRGLVSDLIPAVYDAAHLGEALAERAAGRVLLLRAEAGSPALPEALARRGVPYEDVPVYRTRCALAHSRRLRRALEAGEIDFVTLTSASTVRALLAAAGPEADFSKTLGLCIGPQTAAEARKYGIPVRVAAEATVDALAELAVESHAFS